VVRAYLTLAAKRKTPRGWGALGMDEYPKENFSKLMKINELTLFIMFTIQAIDLGKVVTLQKKNDFFPFF
jgi:hypothetical protein